MPAGSGWEQSANGRSLGGGRKKRIFHAVAPSAAFIVVVIMVVGAGCGGYDERMVMVMFAVVWLPVLTRAGSPVAYKPDLLVLWSGGARYSIYASREILYSIVQLYIRSTVYIYPMLAPALRAAPPQFKRLKRLYVFRRLPHPVFPPQHLHVVERVKGNFRLRIPTAVLHSILSFLLLFLFLLLVLVAVLIAADPGPDRSLHTTASGWKASLESSHSPISTLSVCSSQSSTCG